MKLSFAHSRVYDLLCASPLILTYGFAMGGTAILLVRHAEKFGMTASLLAVASQVSTFIYFGMQAGLCLVRRLPLAKSDGVLPRATAILAANANFGLLLLPRVALPPIWSVLATALTIVGTLGAIAVLVSLGRGFSILPEARQFTSSGPYRHIRHPLYLTEIVATIGIAMHYAQPWAALIALACVALQFERMRHEEAVMRAAFPDYAGYAAHTARLLPGLY
ncbi:MAG: isoprenylcysteine carboxylmethyltransferase family protein [Proteobacteria bacterium]|nr:isoprenylcysteine carboxylmethyltransferase family protein [Pseudomonadota bacterium]